MVGPEGRDGAAWRDEWSAMRGDVSCGFSHLSSLMPLHPDLQHSHTHQFQGGRERAPPTVTVRGSINNSFILT